MRQNYFVPDRSSRILSDRGGPVFFQNGRDLPEDLYLRFCCNAVCRMIQTGLSWPVILSELNIEDEDLLTESFRRYTGMSPAKYRRWCLNRQKK